MHISKSKNLNLFLNRKLIRSNKYDYFSIRSLSTTNNYNTKITNSNNNPPSKVNDNNTRNLSSSNSYNFLTTSTKNAIKDSPLIFEGSIFNTWPKLKLLRNSINFTACQYDFLLNNSEKIMIYMYKIPVANKIMRWFIYDQFVGGHTIEEVKKTAKDLKVNNIEPMLAIPMETEGLTDDMDVNKWQEENLSKMIGCLEYAGQINNNHPPVVHLKVTGIMDNDLFLKLSKYTGFEWDKSTSSEKFTKLTDDLYELMKDSKYKSSIYKEILNESEYNHLLTVAKRYTNLAKSCVDNNVECAIDAEYVNINPAIGIVTMAMARLVNTKEKAFIWNTYQCYLKNTPNIVNFEIDYLKKYDLAWGAKIVRGAYMEKERLRAELENYPDPVNENIEKTHYTYNTVCKSLIDKMNQGEKLKILVASHNEDTVKFVYHLREKCKTPDNIIFGQLFGMCDHISSELGNNNMPIYKSMPIGSFEDVMPYLARRGTENKSVMRGNHKEAKLLRKSLFGMA